MLTVLWLIGFINIILCLLGFIPGLLHSWYIIAKYPISPEVYEYDYESQAYYGNGTHVHHHYIHRRNGGNGGGACSHVPARSGYAPLPQRVIITNSPASTAAPSFGTFNSNQHNNPQSHNITVAPVAVSSPGPSSGPVNAPSTSSQGLNLGQQPSDSKINDQISPALPQSLPPSYDEVMKDTLRTSSP